MLQKIEDKLAQSELAMQQRMKKQFDHALQQTKETATKLKALIDE